MDFLLLNILGKSGLILSIGLMIFFYVYLNSEIIFTWIEEKTFGTRDFILSQADLLFYKIDVNKLSWGLLLFCIGGALLTFIAFSLLINFWVASIFSLIFLIFGWQIPKPIMKFLVNKRRSKFLTQMVDGLNLVSSGLRAGLSLPQAMGMVVEELPNPISQEFNLVLQQNRLGVPLEECLEDMNTRLASDDVQMFVTSITILRETGGNLPETFDTIADVVRERVRLEQKIQAYVAQGKTQGTILCLMPFVLLTMFTVSDPETMSGLYTSLIGIAMLTISIGLVLLGGFFMLKIIKIKA